MTDLIVKFRDGSTITLRVSGGVRVFANHWNGALKQGGAFRVNDVAFNASEIVMVTEA